MKTRTCKNENKEHTEISNDSLRMPSTEIVPSPRVNVLDKPPYTIDKITTKYKSPLELKAPTIQQSSNSIAMRTTSCSIEIQTYELYGLPP